jgi:hypothetical protein
MCLRGIGRGGEGVVKGEVARAARREEEEGEEAWVDEEAPYFCSLRARRAALRKAFSSRRARSEGVSFLRGGWLFGQLRSEGRIENRRQTD